eukprot:GHVO01067610.1.p1 GENE.GHVO01067610.1~~GHVO01067610.1.p1  ORF type:complete len:624 (+),score=59.61 GHVO01067610.1:89-1960(+)
MNSDMTKPEAFEALDLPIGADKSQITASYKRLANKWFPEKHSNNRDAIKKFQEVSMAFYKLLSNQDKVLLTYPQMLKLYSDVNFQSDSYSNGYDTSSSEESDSESEEDEVDALQERLHQANGTNGHSTGQNSQLNNIGLASSNDNKAKKKADKRRAKKKRRREKKKLEKQEQSKKGDDDTANSSKEAADNSKSKKKKKETLGDSESDEFDTGAAFFTHVINKKKKSANTAPSVPTDSSSKNKENKMSKSEESEDLDPIVLRSRQLAIRGNQMANSGHYQAAIDLFSEAVRLDSGDFRFFGNRSFCYDRVHQFERALKDAEKAINLSPEWPKGYFRKGRALAGLKLYAEAEQAFTQVLKLDRNCEDAHQELHRVRTHQISEMGFSAAQAEAAIQTYGSVQQALDSLLADVAENALTCSEVYESDDDDYTSPGLPAMRSPGQPQSSPSRLPPAPMQPATISSQNSADIKLDPRNPEGLTALWVGNVLPEVTNKTLESMFAKYGAVTSVRCLPEKYCAFVNFKSKESAGNAMHALQGKECGGQKLLIKFPDNPVASNPTGNLIMKKPTKNSKPIQPPPPIDDKLSGPVNGDECYFWRTTGCQFGRTCHYSHVPEHKGVDRKPWQKL